MRRSATVILHGPQTRDTEGAMSGREGRVVNVASQGGGVEHVSMTSTLDGEGYSIAGMERHGGGGRARNPLSPQSPFPLAEPPPVTVTVDSHCTDHHHRLSPPNAPFTTRLDQLGCGGERGGNPTVDRDLQPATLLRARNSASRQHHSFPGVLAPVRRSSATRAHKQGNFGHRPPAAQH